MMKTGFPVLLIVLVMLLDGCYTPVIEGAQQGYDVSKRESLTTDTSSNDPVAQYKLGNTYCCQGGGPMDDMSVYDNNKATHWYCKAARQGYGPAQLQLARLYSGHAIRGLHLVLRASALVSSSDTDLSVALMWARLAASNQGEGDLDAAKELLQEITGRVTEQERARAAILMKRWRSASCQWSEVFPPEKNSMRSEP